MHKTHQRERCENYQTRYFIISKTSQRDGEREREGQRKKSCVRHDCDANFALTRMLLNYFEYRSLPQKDRAWMFNSMSWGQCHQIDLTISMMISWPSLA